MEAYSSTHIIEVAGVMVANENVLLVLFGRVHLSLLWPLKTFWCWGSLTPIGLPSKPPLLSPIIHDNPLPLWQTVPPLTF